MKGMKFPLDIIWIDENYQIVHIEKSLSRTTYPKVFTSGVKAAYVLEANAGFAEKNSLRIGDQVSIY